MPFQFEKTELPDIIYIQPKIFNDGRGFFFETFKQSDFRIYGFKENFVQSNYSHSTRGTLRGLHYQKNPSAQSKLVSVLSGEIFDVAVDIRKGSPTFGKWIGRTLNGPKKDMLFIPSGFAHGFYVLSDHADVMYFCTHEYSPKDEAGIIWNDPSLAIDWPVPNPILSKKDLANPLLQDAENNFTYT